MGDKTGQIGLVFIASAQGALSRSGLDAARVFTLLPIFLSKDKASEGVKIRPPSTMDVALRDSSARLELGSAREPIFHSTLRQFSGIFPINHKTHCISSKALK